MLKAGVRVCVRKKFGGGCKQRVFSLRLALKCFMRHSSDAPQPAKKLLTNAGVCTDTALAISHISEAELPLSLSLNTTTSATQDSNTATADLDRMQIFGMFFSLPSVHDSYLLYYS
jgi:hypothetical protein